MSLLRQVGKATFAATDLLLPTPKGPRVLIYHRVGEGTSEQMEVKTEDFAWQLDWLVGNREVVDLETAVKRWDEPGADRLVVLTFDDGYEDNYTRAFPLLQDKGFPFVLYLATQMIEYGSNHGVACLDWGQISDMTDSGLVTIGAHTHSHCDLRTVDYAQALREFEHSNRIIEDRLGIRPRHFAYPWGYWAENAHRAVSDTYQTAVLGAPAGARQVDPLRLHRFPVQLSDGRRWFRRRIEGGFFIEEVIRRRLRGYRGP